MGLLFDSRVLAVLALLAIAAIGFIVSLKERNVLKKKLGFAESFLNQLNEYATSGLQNETTYEWMIKNSEKMQDDLGEIGIYANYKPPGANYLLSNVPIILNLLPQLHTFANDEWLRGRPVTNDVYTAVRDTVLRHVGSLEHTIENVTHVLSNPISQFRKGIETILLVPFDILEGLGIFSSSTNRKAHQSVITKLLAGLVALVTFMSGLITVITGWKGFIEGVLSLWR